MHSTLHDGYALPHRPPPMSAWLTARRLAGAALFVSLVSSSIASAQAPRPGAPALYHADSDYDRARALLDARLYAQAAEAFLDFRRAYPAGPRAPEALYYAAEATLASGDEALAADLFGQFRHTYPAHVLAGRSGLALATFYYETGRYAEAEEALLNALDSPLPDARAAHAYYLLGQTTLAQEHPERAVPYFLQSAAQYPDVPTAPAALYAAGTVQVEEEDWTGAAETFSILAERYPDSPQDAQAGLGLAEALARLGRSEEAIDELARRVPLLDDEELARGHLLWGDALLRLDRYDEARDHFQSVPAESSFARRARFGLARIDFDHERWAAASEGFAAVRQALGDAPDDNLSHTATYYEGLALKQLGQLGEAERRLAAVTLRRPDGPFRCRCASRGRYSPLRATSVPGGSLRFFARARCVRQLPLRGRSSAHARRDVCGAGRYRSCARCVPPRRGAWRCTLRAGG